MNKFIFVTTAVLISFLFVGAMYGISFAQNKSSSQATNQTSGGGGQSKGNASAGGIGSVQELTKAIGNNSQIFANNTSIGNPNASMAEKISGETNATNQTSASGGGGASQPSSANQTSAASQAKGNSSARGIGSVQELTKAIGNNSQIFANNTSIGNPNASMAEKMSGESNATNQTNQYGSKGNSTGNLTGSISGSLNKTAESANKTLNQIGKNVSEAAPGVLNKTGEVAKKIIGGAADVISNITSEIKKGIGAK